MEEKILATIIKSRKGYNDLEQLGVREDLSDLGQLLYDMFSEYYTRDPDATEIDLSIIKEEISRSYNKTSDQFLHILSSLDSKTSVPNVIDVVVSQRKHSIGLKLSSALHSESNKDYEIEELMQDYMNACELGKTYKEETIEEINISFWAEKTDKTQKIKLRPVSLNNNIDGGAFPGDNILIFGRPNVGKSLVAINMAVRCILDNKKVLWIENEDPLSRLIPRFICRTLGYSWTQIQEQPTDYEEQFLKKIGDNFIIKHLHPGTFREINSLIEKYKPEVVVINQLRNIKIGKTESNVVALEKAATEARNSAGRYKVVMINTTQAGESAEGKAILSMSDVDSSKTGIPGQMDLMLGVGMDDRLNDMDRRMFTICKNKMSTFEGSFVVEIDKSLSKVISI